MRGLPVELRRRAHGQRQEVARLEAEVGLLQADEAAQQQARADEQHERDGDLRDDQKAARTPDARLGGSAAPRLLEREVEVGLRDLQPRQQSHQQTRRQRDERREGQHPHVHTRLVEPREPQPFGHEREQGFDAPQGQHDPERAARQRQQNALREQLPHDPPARRAERRAYRHLLVTRRRAREQKVRDVGARDEQHEADRAEEDEQRRARLRPDQSLAQGDEAHAPVRVRVGVGLGESRGDAAQLLLRLRARHTFTDAADDREISTRTLTQLARLARQRRPDLRVGRVPELLRHDADHGRAPAADERQLLTDDARVSAEAALPEPVTQNDGARPARAELFRRERAAERGRDAEQREEVFRDAHARDHLGQAARVERQAAARVGRQPLEGAALRAPVHEVRGRDAAHFGRAAAPVLGRGDDHALGRVERQRPHQRRVHDAEDRRVDADAQPQRQHRDQRQPRPLQQRPHPVTQVL